MKKLIVYYSKTGNSKRIAMAIAKATGAQSIELMDPTSYKGIFGFFKGGRYASSWKKVDYRLSDHLEIDDNTHVYLISPVWASRTAPAMYSFLMDQKLENKSLVLTNLGSNPEKAYRLMEEKFGLFVSKYCISKNKHNEEQVLQQIMAEEVW
jgi:hypothetical protein